MEAWVSARHHDGEGRHHQAGENVDRAPSKLSAIRPLTVRERRMPLRKPETIVPTTRPRWLGSARSPAKGVRSCPATVVSPTAAKAASKAGKGRRGCTSPERDRRTRHNRRNEPPPTERVAERNNQKHAKCISCLGQVIRMLTATTETCMAAAMSANSGCAQ